MYTYVCMCMCMCLCVCVCTCVWHGYASSVCLMKWLMAAPCPYPCGGWRPGRVRDPSHWSCKPTTGIHRAYTSYNAKGGACTWTRSFDPGPCYCPWPIHRSEDSPAWSKFNACKQVTQCPLVGQVDTFHGGLILYIL